MSKYSGKCDFCDVIEIWGEEIILNCKIMLDDKTIYEAKTIEDLKPYFAHIISHMGISKEKNEEGFYGIIYLSRYPYTEILKDRLRDIYEDKDKWQERCEQIDDLYGGYQKELYHPFTVVSYEDENGLTHYVPFKNRLEANIFYAKIKKGKNIHIINIDGETIKYI